MSIEAGTDQPKDHTQSRLETPESAATEPVRNRTGPKPKDPHPINIEIVGKCVGRDKRPVASTDVFKLSAIGMKDIEIAEWFGIDGNTLRYNFSVELIKGRLTLVQSLRRKQIEVAMSGNPTMLIFLGKNLLGQSDSPLANQEAQILPWEDD